MKYMISLLLVISTILFIGGCEEDTEDYAADIINTYIFESIEFMGTKRWTPKTGQWLRCKLRIKIGPEGGHHDKEKKT